MAEGAYVNVDASAISAEIGKLARRAKNLRGVMRNAALLLVEEVDDMFETSGHGKWQDFSENTKRARGAMSSAKLLLDTGAMAASITPYSDANSAEAFTNDPKAKFHVSDKPRTRLPKRDFFDIDLERVTDEVSKLLVVEIAE
jgi:phage gpG-like protein